MNNDTTIDTLIQDMIDSLDYDVLDIINSDHLGHRLHKYVDNAVPSGYHDLASCLSHDMSLAEVEDSVLLPEKPDVWDILKIAIYERLTQEAYDWLSTVESIVHEATYEDYDTGTAVTTASGYRIAVSYDEDSEDVTTLSPSLGDVISIEYINKGQ